jgi:hypothetical protein
MDDSSKLREQQIKSVSQKDQVCIIGHITASSSEMDNTSSSWSYLAEGTESRVSILRYIP